MYILIPLILELEIKREGDRRVENERQEMEDWKQRHKGREGAKNMGLGT